MAVQSTNLFQIKNSEKKIVLNLTSQNIDSVILFFIQKTGITIVKDPSINSNTKLPIYTSHRPITLSEAWEAFRTSLDLSNLEVKIVHQDIITVVKKIPALVEPTGNKISSDEILLKVYKITGPHGSNINNLINNVIDRSKFRTSYEEYSHSLIVMADNITQEQIEFLIQKIDINRSSSLETRIFKPNYITSSDLQNVLTQIFISKTNDISITVDIRTNSLIMVAPLSVIKDTEYVLKHIDLKDDRDISNINVVILKYRIATEIVQIVSRIRL